MNHWFLPENHDTKTYVESAGPGGTFEDYVWVIERLHGPAGNITWKCNFCAMDRIGQKNRLLPSHLTITGFKFGSLQVKQC